MMELLNRLDKNYIPLLEVGRGAPSTHTNGGGQGWRGRAGAEWLFPHERAKPPAAGHDPALAAGGGGSAKYLVLVLDHRTTRVLSSALSMFDVMQEGLALVESLEKSRQPMPEMEVIYFIEPSERSIQMVCDDFADPKKPKYGARGGRWWDWVVVVVVKRGRVVCVCVCVCVCVTVMRTG